MNTFDNTDLQLDKNGNVDTDFYIAQAYQYRNAFFATMTKNVAKKTLHFVKTLSRLNLSVAAKKALHS
jgi:hypothetical protein